MVVGAKCTHKHSIQFIFCRRKRLDFSCALKKQTEKPSGCLQLRKSYLFGLFWKAIFLVRFQSELCLFIANRKQNESAKNIGSKKHLDEENEEESRRRTSGGGGGGVGSGKKRQASTRNKNYRNACVFVAVYELNGNATVWHVKCAMKAKNYRSTLLPQINGKIFIKLGARHAERVFACMCACRYNQYETIGIHLRFVIFTKHKFIDEMKPICQVVSPENRCSSWIKNELISVGWNVDDTLRSVDFSFILFRSPAFCGRACFYNWNCATWICHFTFKTNTF